jgi:hypothetical protein
VLKQLIEQACDLYDWIALLWAAFSEAPSKERLANVNYRRALLPISECKNLFWTRVWEKAGIFVTGEDGFWGVTCLAFTRSQLVEDY